MARKVATSFSSSVHSQFADKRSCKSANLLDKLIFLAKRTACFEVFANDGLALLVRRLMPLRDEELLLLLPNHSPPGSGLAFNQLFRKPFVDKSIDNTTPSAPEQVVLAKSCADVICTFA